MSDEEEEIDKNKLGEIGRRKSKRRKEENVKQWVEHVKKRESEREEEQGSH